MVVTDYPDADLIENLQYNIDHCMNASSGPLNMKAVGYLWGSPIETLSSDSSSSAIASFDLLILADLLFNHSEHAKLVASVQQTLKWTADAKALVFFTPYRPWLLEKDLAFFTLATDGGFVVTKILETVLEKVMFEEDRGVSCASAPEFQPRAKTIAGRDSSSYRVRLRTQMGSVDVRKTTRHSSRQH